MTDYIFNGSNIGPNGRFNDLQNVPEILYALQKKVYGNTNIIIDRSYLTSGTGGNIITQTPNAFAHSHQLNIYSQYVPFLNPFNTSANSFTINNAILVTSWSNFNYYGFGSFMSNDSLSTKYICKDYPYIAFYSNLLLSAPSIFTSRNNGLYSNIDTTYTHPLLENTISGFYDLSYRPYLIGVMNCNDTIPVEIITTNGSWILDNDSGVITFYDSNFRGVRNPKQVSRSNPPRISFFRYEGLFGEANILQGQDL